MAAREPIRDLADKVRDALSGLLDSLAPEPRAVPVPIPVRDEPRRPR